MSYTPISPLLCQDPSRNGVFSAISFSMICQLMRTLRVVMPKNQITETANTRLSRVFIFFFIFGAWVFAADGRPRRGNRPAGWNPQGCAPGQDFRQ